MTLRLTKALLWLQWRLLVNGLKGGRQRDSLERVSRWSDVVVPVLGGVLLVPVVLAVAALGGLAGFLIATRPASSGGVTMGLAIGFLLPVIWLVVRPLAFASQGGLERGELLRLLPIPLSFLRRLELFRAVLDPIYVPFAAAAAILPFGALLGGRPLLALIGAGAGFLLFGFLACVSALVALGTQILLRDRRRGELVTLIFFLVLSGVGVFPQLFVRPSHPAKVAQTGAATSRPTPPVAGSDARRAGPNTAIPDGLRFVPSGFYAVGVEAGAAGHWGSAGLNLGALGLLTVLAYAATAPLHRRLLETPETAGARVLSKQVRVKVAWIPGFSPVVAALALTHVRIVLRTVRGKMMVIGPTFTTMLFALAFSRGSAREAAFMSNPSVLAALPVVIALLNLSAILCNQFAVDGAALVLEFLQPIQERDLLFGKITSAALLYSGSVSVALVLVALVVPRVLVALLAAALLGGLAALFALAPVHAILSATFPKTADLGKLGKAGQPHPTASLLSVLATPVALVPGAVCIFIAWQVAGSVAWAPLFTAAWAIAAWLIALVTLPLVARLAVARRENLAMVAVGR